MIIDRSKKNPILIPNKNHSWEAQAVFNGCPVRKGDSIYLVYRALSLPHYHSLAGTKLMVSDIGIAKSSDGIEFQNGKRFITPEETWERFGCEDPRVTELDGKYYIFYTALSAFPFRAEGIKVGLAISRDLETIEERHLVTPFNAKGMALFPQRINGKMWAILTVNTDNPPAKIALYSFDKEEDLWSEKKWQNWYKNFESNALPLARRPQDQIEVGTPPIKTEAGWLLFYSYINNYFSDKRFFGIEAVLLDLENPLKIIAKTNYPLLTAEEYYERIGIVPNVIFPSGAFVKDNTVYLYYGAADTTCALSFVDLPAFLEKLLKTKTKKEEFIRARENPIISPVKNNSWEAKNTFNPAAIYLEDKVHLIYRAQALDNTSVFGYATSKDGIHIDYRFPEPIYLPREGFEQKLVPGGNSGCEDPRLTKIGDKIYMCYTAYDGKNLPRAALTFISEEDFLKRKWNFAKPVLISPPDLDDKDVCIFPEKINGKYFIIHRSGDDIDSAFIPTLDFDGKTWIEEYRWVSPRKGMWDSKKIGAAAPPLKTKKGWIFLYHGVSEEDGYYRIGALLLDLEDPIKIIARTDEPIFEPQEPYEKNGEVPNIVFSCGAVIIGENIFMYYGAADKAIGVSTMKTDELLNILEGNRC